MANTWKPKHAVKCDKCGWTGSRAVIARSCPSCGHWHPMRAAAKPILVLWHPEGKPMLAKQVCVKVDRTYARSEKGDWWLLSEPSSKNWRSPVLKIKRDRP